MMRFSSLIVVGAVISSILPGYAAEHFDFNYPPPENSSQLQTRRLWSTQYLVHAANAQPAGNDTVEIRSRNGSGTGLNLTRKDWCNAAMEGTVVVSKGGELTTYNVDGLQEDSQVDCSFLFHHTDPMVLKRLGRQVYVEVKGSREFGLGINGYRLVPYRTVATDRSLIPPGTVLFIQGLKGVMVQLPDGTSARHDGYVFAGDRGGSITGNHIDFFTGISKTNPAPAIITSNAKRPFTAQIVTDNGIVSALTDLHLKK